MANIIKVKPESKYLKSTHEPHEYELEVRVPLSFDVYDLASDTSHVGSLTIMLFHDCFRCPIRIVFQHLPQESPRERL